MELVILNDYCDIMNIMQAHYNRKYNFCYRHNYHLCCQLVIANCEIRDPRYYLLQLKASKVTELHYTNSITNNII